MCHRRRFDVLDRLGIRPPLNAVVREALEAQLADPEHGRRAGETRRRLSVLDAGCGGSTFLRRYRARIGRLVGLDIHEPEAPPTGLDALVIADMCRERDAFAPSSFDLVVSKFTVEHLADPVAAFGAMASWLKPGGSVLLVTVNRRHPLVALYLALPRRPRAWLQRRVKASAADAHELEGHCNDAACLRSALRATGFERISIRSVGNLTRAWGRWAPGYVLGLLGDVVAQPFPGRRSTLIVRATTPTDAPRPEMRGPRHARREYAARR
jgi:SAM-dependent methyltransferase